MRNKNAAFLLAVMLFSLLILSCRHSPAAAEEFTGLIDYQTWAAYVGYPQGILTPLGVDGINQDYFHSLPYTPGYTSGRIVIGDSRCCQLGIYQNVMGGDDYAVFAVWGGHYVPGIGTSILTDEALYEIEQCFRAQIQADGRSTVFFFATVNDFDYAANNNAGYISAAITAAERIASLSYAYEGNVWHPQVIVIGFDGGQITAAFNRYVDSYNTRLREAVNNSPVLRENASFFTTVPEITGGRTGFISDGLHYSEGTLQQIADHLKSIP